MNKPPLQVTCPGCAAAVAWSEENPERPFCSSRCKAADFIAWANEEQIITGDADYDDVLSEDIRH